MIKSRFGFLKFPAASPVLTRKPPPQVYADKRTTVNLCCEADRRFTGLDKSTKSSYLGTIISAERMSYLK